MPDLKNSLIASTTVYQKGYMTADIALSTRDAADAAELAETVIAKSAQATDKVKLTGKLGYAGGIGVFAMSAAATADAMIHIAKNPSAFSNYSDTLLQGLAGMADGIEDVAAFAANNSAKFASFLEANPAVGKVIEKIGGPAAIVSGLINLKNNVPELIDQIKAMKEGKGDKMALTSASLGTLSAGLTAVGGVLMMTGGGAPAGAALVAVGGVLCLAQYAVDNWETIKDTTKAVGKKVSQELDGAAHAASGFISGAKKWLFGS